MPKALSCLVIALLANLPVSDDCLAAEPLRQVIDEKISAKWKSQNITPTEKSSDGEFVRRVYLDLLGVTPSYDEAIAFLNDADPQKREKLIDKLLEHPRFGLHQADVWDMVYFGRNPPGYGTDKREGFQTWLAEQFQKNTPYHEWVGEILRAEGNTVEQGAPMFFVQYKNRPEDATEAVTQKFLGVQLQCARCHDHPFDDWKQTDFYGVAAFFARLNVVDVGNKNKQKAYAIGEKNLGDVLFTGPAIDQKPGQKGEPIAPKFLTGELLEEPAPPKDVKDPRNFPSGKIPPAPYFSRKNALADWITDPKNPYFAKAAVNRIWGQFLGKGIVHPVDNLSPNNPPSHPELLEALTQAFVESGFDVKALVREILNSEAYQLASSGSATEAMPLWYERARFRPLSAEELFESWLIAAGYPEEPKPEDRFRVRGFTWDYLRQAFGRPNDGQGNFQGGLGEHLYLNNGQVHQLISKSPGSLYHALSSSKDPWENRVERMFVQVLSRRPSPAETEKFTAYLSEDKDADDRLHEAIWTLMTCSEFRFNH